MRSNLAVSAIGAKLWRFREGLPELMRIGIWIMEFIRQKKEGGKRVRLPDQHNDRILVSFLS